jgi:hypothetical protein
MTEDKLDAMTAAPADETALATTSEDDSLSMVGAFSDEVVLEASDLQIPRIRLAQQLTPEVAEGTEQAGNFIMTGFDSLDALTIVPMKMAKRRLYLDSDTQDVLCRSNDSITGEGDPGGNCASCPHKQWGENKRPPACNFMYSYMFYVAQWDVIAICDFRKTSVKSGQVLNTMIARAGGLKRTVAKLAAMKRTKKQYTYYIMVIQPATDITPEERDQILADAVAMENSLSGMS